MNDSKSVAKDLLWLIDNDCSIDIAKSQVLGVDTLSATVVIGSSRPHKEKQIEDVWIEMEGRITDEALSDIVSRACAIVEQAGRSKP